jgi:hypothetical protein
MISLTYLVIKPIASSMTCDLMLPLYCGSYQFHWYCHYQIGWIVTWLGVAQYVCNLIKGLTTIPFRMLGCTLLKIMDRLLEYHQTVW